MGSLHFGSVGVSDVEVPSSEQLVAKVGLFVELELSVALIVCVAHPVQGKARVRRHCANDQGLPHSLVHQQKNADSVDKAS